MQFGEIILVAPDIDAGLFEQLSVSVGDITRGITIYVNAKDKALELAATITGRTRAGEITKAGPAVSSNVDVIDITERDNSLLGHFGFAKDGSILADIQRLLEASVRPPSRRSPNIREIRGQKGPYWKSY